MSEIQKAITHFRNYEEINQKPISEYRVTGEQLRKILQEAAQCEVQLGADGSYRLFGVRLVIEEKP